MATMNQEFFDALVRHQIYILRYGKTLGKQINAILDKTEGDIADKIRSRLLDNKGLDTVSFQKLKSLEEYIKTVRYQSWDEIDKLWVGQATELAKKEPQLTLAALQTTSPVILDLALPAPSLLKAIVTEQPMQGRVLKDWSGSLRKTDVSRMMDQIKIGLVQGESSQQIARRIVGSAQLNGIDGVTQITRNNAEAITRTVINHVTNAARTEFQKENRDFFDQELFVATLDSRTTPVCRANDGKMFPVAQGPMVPLHWSCRSLRIAVIDSEIIGSRPMKASTEKQLLREYAKQNDLSPLASRDSLPFGHKGSFDSFAGQRVRELTGTIPAKVSYQEWLKTQSAAFQDDVLGKTKGALFRKGGLPLDKFVDNTGKELSLAGLAATHKKAFEAAGLNPENFLD